MQQQVININSTVSPLPLNSMGAMLDEQVRYYDEKDKSNKYRFVFTINPVCSNVLFNACTEIVKDEGSDTCEVVGGNKKTVDIQGYKAGMSYQDMIRDTAPSHKELGGYTYHCGYDIFNNHTLRKREFNVVNKCKGTYIDTDFNTIKDYLRDKEGNNIKVDVYKKDNIRTSTLTTPRHLYLYDTIKSFSDSINDNLVEENGWVGFVNPATLNIPNLNINGKDISINKCINNKNAYDMVDMYPERDLFSFVPKYNPYRNRNELNWEYIITYPSGNLYNEIVENGIHHINGLKCEVISPVTFDDIKLEATGMTNNYSVEIRTDIKNNFKKGDYIKLSLIYGGEVYETGNSIKIENVGRVISGITDYYFSVSLYDFASEFIDLAEGEKLEGEIRDAGIEIRVRRSEYGIDCEYYFRKFSILPNFKLANINSEDIISEEVAKKYMRKEFSSSLNKLAYSKNIFSDQISQIVFEDDIDTTLLRDNLGRELTEIYLTIVKTNKGYEKWYAAEPDYGSEEVEYSHCFGKITSGLDLPSDVDDYNIHKIHNIDISKLEKSLSRITASPKCLESEIAKFGAEANGYFLGDIVELDKYNAKENILEGIYHRFNTAQREDTSKDSDFYDIKYDEIYADDYDVNNEEYTSGFDVRTMTYNAIYKKDPQTEIDTHWNGNIFPEGYYYQPHYKLHIKSFSDEVQQGFHRKINGEITGGTDTLTIETTNEYYLNPQDRIKIYDKSENKEHEGYVSSVTKTEGKTIITVKHNITGLSDNISLFKVNSEMPSGAIEFKNGSGGYVWRDILKNKEIFSDDELYDSMFTNDAHYFHKNINFYLRRQDPLGNYGLSREVLYKHYGNLVIDGEITDVQQAEYVENNDGSIC